ncbi:hypothetical protein HDU96_008428 [Phlyctochytrium bullatum]|nr:hypothetical protein HDU96_008428 [Phlyctochytrium bullatum]
MQRHHNPPNVATESTTTGGDFLVSVDSPLPAVESPSPVGPVVEPSTAGGSTSSAFSTPLRPLLKSSTVSSIADSDAGGAAPLTPPPMRLPPKRAATVVVEPRYDAALTMSSVQLAALVEMAAHRHVRVVREDGTTDSVAGEDDDETTVDVFAEAETGEEAPTEPDPQEPELPPDAGLPRLLPRFTTMDFANPRPSKGKVSHQKHKQRVDRHFGRRGVFAGVPVRGAKPTGDSDDTQSLPSRTSTPAPDTCALCDAALHKPLGVYTIQIRRLKPRFVREIKRLHPGRGFPPGARICVKDLHAVLQARIEMLLEEDQTQLARLLDDAMKNIGEYEQHEEVWQKQFELGWTWPEKAADAVASSIAALQAPVIMMSQNRQSQLDRAQNSYVSKIGLRAEHQVRHVNAKVDHLLITHRKLSENDAQPSRAESTTVPPARPSNLSESPSSSSPAATAPGPAGRTIVHSSSVSSFQGKLGGVVSVGAGVAAPRPGQNWILETLPDLHTKALLGFCYGETAADPKDWKFQFAHWHTDGESFSGTIQNVRVELRGASVLKKLTYDLTFSDPAATLDDVFSGEGTVMLRNDFDLKYMALGGKLATIVVHSKDRAPTTYNNGDLPPRYKTVFSNYKRADKISDAWKQPITRLTLGYVPPYPAAVLTVKANQSVRRLRFDFFHSPRLKTATVYMKCVAGPPPNFNQKTALLTKQDGGGESGRSTPVPGAAPSSSTSPVAAAAAAGGFGKFPDPLEYLNALMGPRPLKPEVWKKYATAEWAAPPGEAAEGGGSTDGHYADLHPITCVIEDDLRGPACYVFLCDETKVCFHATIEDL